MKDLTKGPVGGHVLQLATFIALTTTFQTLYFLADLYFVGRLGKEAIAGVGLAGNLMFLVLALTQSLGVGATSLIAQAIGRKDRERAELLFNQALVLSNLTGLAFGVWSSPCAAPTAAGWPPTPTTAGLGAQYLNWFVPALFLQFPLVAMGAALRGMGDMKIPTAIQVGTVVLNIVLAPTLMFGWVTRTSARRRRRGAGFLHRHRRSAASPSPRTSAAARSPAALPPRRLDARSPALGRDAAHRPARGRRVRPDVRLHGPGLRHHPALRRGGPGGVRHRRAAGAVAVPARRSPSPSPPPRWPARTSARGWATASARPSTPRPP